MLQGFYLWIRDRWTYAGRRDWLQCCCSTIDRIRNKLEMPGSQHEQRQQLLLSSNQWSQCKDADPSLTTKKMQQHTCAVPSRLLVASSPWKSWAQEEPRKLGRPKELTRWPIENHLVSNQSMDEHGILRRSSLHADSELFETYHVAI